MTHLSSKEIHSGKTTNDIQWYVHYNTVHCSAVRKHRGPQFTVVRTYAQYDVLWYNTHVRKYDGSQST